MKQHILTDILAYMQMEDFTTQLLRPRKLTGEKKNQTKPKKHKSPNIQKNTHNKTKSYTKKKTPNILDFKPNRP